VSTCTTSYLESRFLSNTRRLQQTTGRIIFKVDMIRVLVVELIWFGLTEPVDAQVGIRFELRTRT
jgi:hypothetical protein